MDRDWRRGSSSPAAAGLRSFLPDSGGPPKRGPHAASEVGLRRNLTTAPIPQVLPAIAHLLTLILVIAGATVGARANVLPELILRFHVAESPDPTFCETAQITNCTQLTRATMQAGDLAFDLFFEPTAYQGEDLPIHILEADLIWTENWEVISLSACADGWWNFTPGDSGGHLLIIRTVPPQMTEHLFPVCQMLVHVAGEGRIEVDGTAEVAIGSGPDYIVVEPHRVDVDEDAPDLRRTTWRKLKDRYR